MKIEYYDLNKEKNIYQIYGKAIWKYNRYCDWYSWGWEGKQPVLINKSTNEKIKCFTNIIRFLKLNELQVEKNIEF